jgi:uncharacterized OB-fold protein
MPAPKPLIGDTSRPFWNALREERIELQQCDDCSRWVWHPRVICPHCGGTALAWQRFTGPATLYTFTVAEAPVSPEFADAVPQLLAIVELAEEVRLASTLVNIAPDDIRIGMALEPVFDHTAFDDITLLRFQPYGQ